MNETSKRLLIIAALAAGGASFLVTPTPAAAVETYSPWSCLCTPNIEAAMGIGCEPLGSVYFPNGFVATGGDDGYGYICKNGSWLGYIPD